MLRLYRGYDIPITTLTGRKYGLQFVGPFKVLKRIERLAYLLDIPNIWKVYSVFIVAQLKPVPDPKEDPYISTRSVSRSNESSLVFVKGDINDYKSYDLDRILNKRVIKKGRGYATEYLVK